MNDKTHKKLHEGLKGLFETPDDALKDLKALRKYIPKMIKYWKERENSYRLKYPSKNAEIND